MIFFILLSFWKYCYFYLLYIGYLLLNRIPMKGKKSNTFMQYQTTVILSPLLVLLFDTFLGLFISYTTILR